MIKKEILGRTSNQENSQEGPKSERRIGSSQGKRIIVNAIKRNEESMKQLDVIKVGDLKSKVQQNILDRKKSAEMLGKANNEEIMGKHEIVKSSIGLVKARPQSVMKPRGSLGNEKRLDVKRMFIQ